MNASRFRISTALMVLGLICGGPARAASPGWPEALLIATASPGGTYHAYGLGLARVLSRVLGIPVFVQETEGPTENIRLIEDGRAQLGFVTTGAALQAWSGTGDWTEGRRYRAMTAIFAMYDTPFHFVARRDSPVRSLADMAGKAIGAGPQGGTAAAYAPRLLASLGIEMRPVHGTWADLAAQLQTGQLDGLAVAAGVPFPAISELEARRAIRYLPVSRGQVQAMRLVAPELAASVIPAGTYPSLMTGYETVGLYNIAVAHRALPADLVYAVVDAVYDNHAEMVEAHPAAAATVPANFVHNTVLPWHPGAMRYLANRAVPGVVSAD
jgi:TRAP transporter TAXI family solute receptor